VTAGGWHEKRKKHTKTLAFHVTRHPSPVTLKMFKKKLKKMLTPAWLSGKLVSHTVTTEQQHKTK
jgi:hypothetical protein